MNLATLSEKSGVSVGLISQIERELVTPSVVSIYNIARALDMLLLTIAGGEEYSREKIGHEGEECVYVLSGELTFLIDEEELKLQPGDSIYFDSTHPHRYLNCGKEDCVSIWAITPRFF